MFNSKVTHLDASVASEAGPGGPVILVERIFDGDHRELLDELLVKFGQLGRFQVSGWVGLRVLEVQVILAIPSSAKSITRARYMY